MKEGWAYKKVKEVCEKASSNIVLNKIEDNTGDYPLFGASGFVKGVDFYHRDEPYIGVVKDGSGVGRVDVYPAKSSLVGTMQYILPKKECLLKYLCYALQGLKLSQFVSGAAIPHIYFRDYGECSIPIPPQETQISIVEELDLVSSILEKQKLQIKELDNLAQSIFDDMFGDPVENEKGWEMKKLGELSSLITNGTTPKGGAEVYVKEGILFLRSQNVWRNRIEYDDIAYIDDRTNDSMKKSSLHHNDILITKTGRINTENSSLGRAALYTGRTGAANINGHVYLVRLLDGISHQFVLRILTSHTYRDYIRKVCVGGIDKRQINKEHVDAFPIITPPLSLQQSFAAKIESIEKQKALISKSIEETQKLFDYTMDKHFG